VKNVKVGNNPRKGSSFCCGANGEKLQPLVFGNAAHPCALKEHWTDTKHLSLEWHSNKKAWITHKIFKEWLEYMNHMIRTQNQKILLLVDNATSHSVTKVMSNVTVKFIPQNITFEVQLSYQGSTQAAKS
jgi:hypothetical protein